MAEDVRFSEQHVDELIKKFILTLWNTYSFFVTYANIDGWSPKDNKEKECNSNNKLDRWILSELNSLIEESTMHLDDYNLTKATRPMMDFVDNLSNWYIRRSRRRFWKSENDEDKHEAYKTLYVVLKEFSKLIAPFMPFISEEIYRNLTKNDVCEEDSVHLCDWPTSQKKCIRPELNEEMAMVRKVVTLGHAVRAQSGIKVRQPLSKVKVGLPDSVDPAVIKQQEEVIIEELNVKELELLTTVGEFVTQTVKPDSRKLGPKYGKQMQKIIRDVKEGNYTLFDDGRVKAGDIVLDPDEVEIGFKGKEGFDVQGEDGFVVVLDTTITDDLRHEGHARDIIRYIQEMRKDAGYEVYERIYLQIKSEGDIDDAVTKYADYIKKETLAVELQQSGEFMYDKEQKIDIDGYSVVIAVKQED